VFEAHRLVYHSTLGLRVIKRERFGGFWSQVSGFGFRVEGFRVTGCGFRVSGIRFRVLGVRCQGSGSGYPMLYGSHCRVSFGFRISSFGFRVSGFRISVFDFQVSGFGIHVSGLHGLLEIKDTHGPRTIQ